MSVNVQRLKMSGFHDYIDDTETEIREHLRTLTTHAIEEALKRAASEADDVLVAEENIDGEHKAGIREQVKQAILAVGRFSVLAIAVSLLFTSCGSRFITWSGKLKELPTDGEPCPCSRVGDVIIRTNGEVMFTCEQEATACAWRAPAPRPYAGQPMCPCADVGADSGSKVCTSVESCVVELADAGRPYPAIARNPDVVAAALAEIYDGPVQVSPEAWTWPAGAFAESTGPT